jgi:hypothetical protein
MEKEITYNGKKYTIQIKFGLESYFMMVVGFGGFHAISFDCLKDIEKLKPYIIKAIENGYDYDMKELEKWDGIL